MHHHFTIATAVALQAMLGCHGTAAGAEAGSPTAPGGNSAPAHSLAFDTRQFTVKTLIVGGRSNTYRAYEGIVYVARPVDARYERLNFYAPVEYFEGKSVGGYTAETAPIFFPNSVGGYMPGLPASADRSGAPGGFRGPGTPPPGGPNVADRPSAIAQALAHGLVVAAPGARGRTLRDADGVYTGKAPACIVDLKAAVRYLRHNDKLMPGDAERIISNGTSAGGALSALVGATGNSPDYEPYLQAIGAAEARDDIFAASCYCPITDLDHADAAYEWQFNGVNTYHGRGGGSSALSPEQLTMSGQLKTLYPPYLNRLNLKGPDGAALVLDADGNGSFRDFVKSLVLASAREAQLDGQDLATRPWIILKEGKVTDLDFAGYVAGITRMKTPPAFDALDLRTPENSLFGTAAMDCQHFTEFGKEHSTDHTMADAAVVRMMNPLNYIGAPGVATARYWRIRHGTADRDTSLAVPAVLATKLRNSGRSVDFALPWAQGHGGDYDLDALFAWVDQVCR